MGSCQLRNVIRATAVIAALAISAINLSGCTAPKEPTPTASSDGKLHVVTSISNWGDIAHEIGGDFVDVQAIISDPNKDPHSYEATPRDQLAVNLADLVIANGLGYDDFVIKMVDASINKRKLFNLGTSLHWATMMTQGPNQHIWFNLPMVKQASEIVAAKFSALDPSHSADYASNLRTFDTSIGKLLDQAVALAKITKGYKYFATEPIANDLLDASGFVDQTPKAFSDAIENETDVPPATMQASIDMIKGHEIDYLVLNKQTSNAQVEKLVAVARDAEVRTVSFSELLPANTTYIAWMTANLKTLNPGM